MSESRKKLEQGLPQNPRALALGRFSDRRTTFPVFLRDLTGVRPRPVGRASRFEVWPEGVDQLVSALRQRFGVIEVPAPGTRANPYWGREGAGVLFQARDTGRLLFALRSQFVREPGTWGTWGGALEPDETPQDAALREAWEEAGLVLDGRDLVPLMVFSDGDFRYSNFIVRVPGEFQPRLNWETAAFRWADIGDWPQPMHPGVVALLQDPRSIAMLRDGARTARVAVGGRIGGSG